MSAAAAIPAEPVIAGTAPGAVYAAAPQQAAYMTVPQAVTYISQPAGYQPQQYVVAEGQTMVMGEALPPGASVAAPVSYEYAASPAPEQYAGAPAGYAAPAVYSISPERFAQIAAGIPLTQEEIQAMTSGATAPAPMEQPAMPMEPAAAAAAAVTSAGAVEKGSKKKSLKKSSKKKKAGCC